MSRLGKKPIQLPANCSLTLVDGTVTAKGALGVLSVTIPSRLSVELSDNSVALIVPQEYVAQSREIGLYRSLLNNIVTGVSKGYSKTLEIIGVGYKASVDGNLLNLSLGFSHPVALEIPTDLKVDIQKGTIVTITGINKYLVGQFASSVRKIRPVEPYKGKGVRISGEVVLLKEGKKK
jgi:large subunit ribosomal protein L6